MKILPIVISVLMTGISQILFRIGMKGSTFHGIRDYIFFLIKNPFVISGLAIMLGGAVLWFYVLSKNPVSFAYPFVGISFILVVIGGYFLGETISLARIIGIFLIIVGILFISKS